MRGSAGDTIRAPRTYKCMSCPAPPVQLKGKHSNGRGLISVGSGMWVHTESVHAHGEVDEWPSWECECRVQIGHLNFCMGVLERTLTSSGPVRGPKFKACERHQSPPLITSVEHIQRSPAFRTRQSHSGRLGRKARSTET